MKKLFFFLALVAMGLLLSSGIALADPVNWVVQYSNPTTSSINDLHIEVFKDPSYTQPQAVTNATAIDPSNWTASIGGLGSNEITYTGGNTIPAGGTIQVGFSTDSSDTSGTIYTRTSLTYNGSVVSFGGKAARRDMHAANTIDASVGPTIILEKPRALDFGEVAAGISYTLSEMCTVSTNKNWDLFAGIQDVPGYGSMIGSLSIRARLPVVPLTGPTVLLAAAGTPYQLLNQAPPVNAQPLQIRYWLNLPGSSPVGSYRAIVTLNAVENY